MIHYPQIHRILLPKNQQVISGNQHQCCATCLPPPSLPVPPSAGAHVGGPEPRRLLQHVHGSREEEGPAPPGVGQEEPARHGLLWPDGVPEENPVPVRTNLQVALHQAFHAVQQHPRCRSRLGQCHGKFLCSYRRQPANMQTAGTYMYFVN